MPERARFMRLLVFFDLPVETSRQRKAYRLFRKSLLKDGYLMVQESVYSKLVLTAQSADFAVERLNKSKPTEGLIQVLKVTEKQYESIINITGHRSSSNAIDSVDRLIVL